MKYFLMIIRFRPYLPPLEREPDDLEPPELPDGELEPRFILPELRLPELLLGRVEDPRLGELLLKFEDRLFDGLEFDLDGFEYEPDRLLFDLDG
jgi:hypothetical protein